MSVSPFDLRVNHLREPLGIGGEPLRVSWKLPEGSVAQLAARRQREGEMRGCGNRATNDLLTRARPRHEGAALPGSGKARSPAGS